MKVYSLMFLVCIVTIGCNKTLPIEKRTLTRDNPKEHIFNIPRAALHDSILNYFSEMRYVSKSPVYQKIFYYTFEDDKHLIYFTAKMEDPYKKNLIYLTSQSYWVSKVYFSDEEPLKFMASFRVSLKDIGNDKTLLSIDAIEPSVINGTVAGGMHFTQARITPVEPTTVEEYSLILFIGEQLKNYNFLPLNTNFKD